MAKPVKVIKIEGLKVFFDDGDTIKKDYNNIWLYEILSPWENRKWYTDSRGLLELDFS